ncbi:MAG: hypothetical protein GY804_14480 [Alphaproteobacteria bacterium]|nr:hypothetical protein [Alphaproteobacteria bacterium]
MDGWWKPSHLPVFALKAAPIQVVWADYPGATGLRAIDYLLIDKYQVPDTEEENNNYTEEVLRMPNDYICYHPAYNLPEPSSLPPCVKNGYITFGVVHNPGKITDQILNIWVDILEKVDSSKILFKYKSYDNPEIKERIITFLYEKRGLDKSRVIFEGKTSYFDHMKRYADIDISFDTHPYGGGITTCDSLSMGVPVITCPSNTPTARQTYSHVVNAGHHDLIAGSLSDYVEKAVSLSNDVEYLKKIRKNLTTNFDNLPIGDGKLFAKHFCKIMRNVWQKYCEK